MFYFLVIRFVVREVLSFRPFLQHKNKKPQAISKDPCGFSYIPETDHNGTTAISFILLMVPGMLPLCFRKIQLSGSRSAGGRAEFHFAPDLFGHEGEEVGERHVELEQTEKKNDVLPVVFRIGENVGQVEQRH